MSLAAAVAPVVPSAVLEYPAAAPQEAQRHFLARLSVETDASDVHADLQRGAQGFVLVDARSPVAFAARRIPGALSLPHRTISAETTVHLRKEDVVVLYCWGPGCNAATKGAAKLAALGFRVKEMLGGLEYWVREGYATEGTRAQGAPAYDDSQLG
jgi:rhodanese-related sulfurtransferase